MDETENENTKIHKSILEEKIKTYKNNLEYQNIIKELESN